MRLRRRTSTRSIPTFAAIASSRRSRTDVVALVARMIGRGQVFAPILDPFDRAAKLQRGGADQKILGIEFTPDAEPAADVTLVKLDGLWCSLQHPCDRVAIPVRDLCGAMQ